ncbi:MAG: DUF4340 protein [Anaerolineales bacterium]|nr:DUF4340 protein [Anaerolineales bacterium]
MVRRTTWILLAAFAVVVVAYAGWRRFAPAPAEATPTAGPESPWSISPEQVESIRLADLSDPAVVVLRAPAIGCADAGRVEAALTAMLAPVVAQTLDPGTDLEPFGLSPAQYRMTLLMVDGTAHSMDVGAVDPTGSVYYVQVPGDGRVLMVSRFSLEDLLGLLGTPPYPLPTETPEMAPTASETP